MTKEYQEGYEAGIHENYGTALGYLEKELEAKNRKLETIGNYIQNFHFEMDQQIIELIKDEIKK